MAQRPKDARDPDAINFPPFETEDLRKNLEVFLDTPFFDPIAGEDRKVGNFKWGVYAFFGIVPSRVEIRSAGVTV
jgi:hypothetical protein